MTQLMKAQICIPNLITYHQHNSIPRLNNVDSKVIELVLGRFFNNLFDDMDFQLN